MLPHAYNMMVYDIINARLLRVLDHGSTVSKQVVLDNCAGQDDLAGFLALERPF